MFSVFLSLSLSLSLSLFPCVCVSLSLSLFVCVWLPDHRIGVKAEKAEAVLLMLGLLRQNLKDAKRAAACLWVLQVFCTSGNIPAPQIP